MVPNLLTQFYYIKRIRHSEFLFDEAEKLGSPRRLCAIEIDAISVASGRDDLQAKSGETHAKERCKPEYTILQSEAVYQEPGRDKYGPSPNRFETNF